MFSNVSLCLMSGSKPVFVRDGTDIVRAFDLMRSGNGSLGSYTQAVGFTTFVDMLHTGFVARSRNSPDTVERDERD